MFRKTYILPNGCENLEMEVAIEAANEDGYSSDVFWTCFLCAITITDKEDPDNGFTVYGTSESYSQSTLYHVIMEPDKRFLFYPTELRRMIISDADLFNPSNMPKCLKNLFIFSSPIDITTTDAFSQCLSRVSKDINNYYQTQFFENNPHLTKEPSDMTYIFEACKNLYSFK